MIKQLKIRNFRAHEKLDLVFSPNVNSIVGLNYAGKSTILRAIKYAAMNKPSGESVITWDKTRCYVCLTDEHKVKVKRIRSKQINLYKLNDKEFKAFGNKVPDEIQQALGLSDVNFQGQHDAPFWFSKTAGEVSRELNVIVNLDVIDTTLANIASEITKTNTTATIISDRLRKAKEDKRRLAYVKSINEDLKRIESLKKLISKNEQRTSLVDKLVDSAIIYSSEYDSCSNRVSGGLIAIEKGAQLRDIRINRKSLRILVNTGMNLHMDIKRQPPSIKLLDTKRKAIQEYERSLFNLKSLITQASNHKERLCQQKEKARSISVKLQKHLGKRCPLCEKKL